MLPRRRIPSVGQEACLPLRLGRASIHACFIAICLPRLSRECHNRGKPANCPGDDLAQLSSQWSNGKPARCQSSFSRR
jgi:hypothetical protein